METANQINVGAWKRISPREIMFFEADINYTCIHFINGGKMTVATSLKILEKRFASCSDFFRTHKSFLVNINYIKAFDYSGNEVFVQMKNDFRIVVSRRKKRAFKHRIYAKS